MSESKQYRELLLTIMANNRWDQETLASRLMVSPSTLSRWLSGKTKISRKNKAWIDQIDTQKKAHSLDKDNHMAILAFEKFNKLSESNQAAILKNMIDLLKLQK